MVDFKKLNEELRVRKEAREPAVVAWDSGVGLYRLRGYETVVGATFPKPGDEEGATVVLHIEQAELLDPRKARALMRSIYRALTEQLQEGRAWAGANALGAVDTPQAIPWTRVRHQEIHCFWVRLEGYETPALAFRSVYATKSNLLKAFGVVRTSEPLSTGWVADMKVWAAHSADPTTYGAILGQLRLFGHKLKWIHREGYPGAPAIEDR